MSKYHKLFIFILILVLGASFTVWKNQMREGLDLAGGIRVVLEADKRSMVNDRGKELTSAQKAERMQAAGKIIEKRLGAYTEPRMQLQGDDRIVIELPGLKGKDAEKRALDDIQSTAQLKFYWLKNVRSQANPTAPWEMHPDTGKDGTDIFIFTNAATGERFASDTPEGQKGILEKVVGAFDSISNPSGERPLLTGDDMLPQCQGAIDPNTNQPILRFEFNRKGADVFAEFTRSHINNYLAIFLGDKILTAPNIHSPITDGSGQIEGGFQTLTEAQKLADLLNAGALPVQLNIIQMDKVDATLGKETVNQTRFAGLIGLALVALFMLFYYRLPGFLADIALCIYALLTYAVFVGFGFTMTLPGLAGFILSIGMAVDANILIFERLKEELKAGKTLKAAIDDGFGRAFTAIFDSNACTIITCIILYNFGSGMVQSFAMTLAIGVLISMFTAITVTRTFLHLLVGHPMVQKPSLYGLSTSWASREGRKPLNIMGKRNWFFAFSLLVIIPGMVFFFLNMSNPAVKSGLKKGIEFLPGTTLQMTFEKPVTVSDVQEYLNSQGVQSEVQISKKSSGYTTFIRTRLTPGKDKEQNDKYNTKIEGIKSGLESKFGNATVDQQSVVGPTVSAELTKNAIWAVIFASLAITLYLSFRFAIGGFLKGLKYGVCAVIALIHDVLVIVGLFAALGYFLNWEVDTLFVTALLTIIGFSVHDTIVVFDRIRENLKHRLKGETYEELANRSVLQTFSRSINTSFTVVLTLAALTALGGSLIQHFYIALLVGIISGTYSSIFNATPLAVVWENFATRKQGKPAVAAVEDKPMVESNRVYTGEESSVSTQTRVKPKKKNKRY